MSQNPRSWVYLTKIINIPNLGLVLERDNPLYIADGEAVIRLDRIHKSPCNDDWIERAFARLPEGNCVDTSRRDRFTPDTKAIKASFKRQCVALMDAEFDVLYSLSGRRQRRSVPQNIIRRQQARNDFDPNHRSRNDCSSCISRSRRSVSDILKFFSPIVNSFIPYVSLFSSLMQTHSERVIIREVNNFNLVAQAVAQRQNLLESFVQNELCQQRFSDSVDQQSIIAASEIRNYVQTLEQEILSLRLGELPKTSEFISVILKLCKHISTNSDQFCEETVFSKNFLISFKGLSAVNGTIVQSLDIKFPLQSEINLALLSYKIANVGHFQNERAFRVKLGSRYLLRSDHQVAYNVDESLCSKAICQISALSHDTTSACFSSLIRNKTEHCESEQVTKSPCSFKRLINGGFLISAQKAEFFPLKSMQLVSDLRNEAMITRSTGRLRCYDSVKASHSTHFLRGVENVDSNSKFSDSYTFNHNLSSTQLETHFKPSAFAREINELKQATNRVEIGSSSYSIIAVILLNNALLLISFLCIFASGNASKITRINPAIDKLWKSCYRRPVPKYTTSMANEDFELKQIPLPAKPINSFTFPRGVNSHTDRQIIK